MTRRSSSSMSRPRRSTRSADRAVRDLQLQGLREHGLTPPQSFTADSADTILGFVAAGLGFSLVPSLAAHGPQVAGVAAWPVNHPKSKFPIVAAWRKRAVAHPLVEAALAAARRRRTG